MSHQQDKTNAETSGQTTLELGKTAVWHLICKEGEDKVSHQIAAKCFRVDHPFMLLFNMTLVNMVPYCTVTMDV